MENKEKLIYVLPSNAKHTHFSYNVEFLKSVSNILNIFLIIEKGEKINHDGLQEYPIETNNTILRLLKTFALIFKARSLGYRKIYIHYSFAAVYCAFLVKIFFLGKLKIYYWNCGMPWHYKRNFLQESYEKIAYKLIDFLVTGGESMVSGYSDFYSLSKSKFIIIQNWVDEIKEELLTDFQKKELKKKLNILENEKVLLHVHRLGIPWGGHNIVPIAREIYKKQNNFKWIVIGSGPLEEQIKKEIIEFGLEKNMLMLGYLPNTEVKKYLQIADCFVLPSDTEGMPRALLEAVVYKLPSAAFAVGTVPDILKATKISQPVEANNIEKISEKILEILNADGKSILEEKNILGEISKEYTRDKVIELFIKKIIS